jgi:LmbE family N-acetylglucosaminyl deacetylase
VGARASAEAGVDAVYQATVDREYLHFVETHLVEEAGRALPAADGPGDLGLAATAVGLPSVLVDLTLDVRAVLDVKRKAMLAHASQITAESSAVRLGPAAFAEVYGFEWYARVGRRGPLDDLAPV